MLTGLICIEEVSLRSSSFPVKNGVDSGSVWTHRRPILSALTAHKWIHAVLDRGALRCFRYHVDIKLGRAPCRVVQLDLQASLVAERQTVIVRSRTGNKTLRLRVHPTSSSSYLQWVTALYLARLEASGLANRAPEAQEEDDGAKRSKRRVTFNEERLAPTVDENITQADSPAAACAATSLRESVDLGELFYSREDLAGFRESFKKTQQKSHRKPQIPGRKIVHSLVAKLRRKTVLS